jgi:hypothetical protein
MKIIPNPENNFLINSPLESEVLLDQAPLEFLLTSILTFHIFILFLLIILLILIFNKYILQYKLNLISSISKKYLNGKIYD